MSDQVYVHRGRGEGSCIQALRKDHPKSSAEQRLQQTGLPRFINCKVVGYYEELILDGPMDTEAKAAARITFIPSLLTFEEEMQQKYSSQTQKQDPETTTVTFSSSS